MTESLEARGGANSLSMYIWLAVYLLKYVSILNILFMLAFCLLTYSNEVLEQEIKYIQTLTLNWNDI